jgi:hypothetical protein
MQVRVEEAGQHVPAAGVDRAPRVNRFTRRQRGGDLAVADRQAAVDDGIGLDDARALDEEVGGQILSFRISP